jgi:hypothetical protein
MLAAALLALCGRFPSLRCVCLAGWPRPSVSSYGGGIISPRGWRCPLPAFMPRFGRFPPFWRPFGVAVVSNAGAVSVRPFRWCRCAYKVATPRAALLCRYPQRGRYFRQQSQRGNNPRHTGAPCIHKPCGLVAGLWWLSRRRWSLRLAIARGAYHHTPKSRAALRWRGNCAPAVLTLSTCQKTFPPTRGGWWPCGESRPANGLNTANAQTGGVMPLNRR